MVHSFVYVKYTNKVCAQVYGKKETSEYGFRRLFLCYEIRNEFQFTRGECMSPPGKVTVCMIVLKSYQKIQHFPMMKTFIKVKKTY